MEYKARGKTFAPTSEKGIIYKCVIIVIAVATDFLTCFSVHRVTAAVVTTTAAAKTTITAVVSTPITRLSTV